MYDDTIYMEDYETLENNMTKKEIQSALKEIRLGYIGDYCFTGTEDDYERYRLHVALRKAIEIIEKTKEEG